MHPHLSRTHLARFALGVMVLALSSCGSSINPLSDCFSLTKQSEIIKSCQLALKQTSDPVIKSKLYLQLARFSSLDEALEYYQDAMVDVHSPLPYDGLAHLYAQTGDRIQALQSITKAILVEPSAKRYLFRAKLYESFQLPQSAYLDKMEARELRLHKTKPQTDQKPASKPNESSPKLSSSH